MAKANILEGLISQIIATTSVGVDITSENIVIVLLRKGGQVNIDEILVIPTPTGSVTEGYITDPTSLGAAVRAALDERKIKEKRIITSVSGQSAIIRPIKFPQMSAQELKNVVLEEAERYIPFDIHEVILDYQPLESFMDADGIPKIEVLLVAAQKDLINTHIAMAEGAGMELAVVDVASFAVMRALADTNLAIAEEETAALILVRPEVTDINIIKGGVPRFSRSAPIGDARFLHDIIAAMSVEYEQAIHIKNNLYIPLEASVVSDPTNEQANNAIRPALFELVSEIERSLEFYSTQSGEKVTKVVLSGSGARIRNLEKFVQGKLNIPVEMGDPLQNLTYNTARYSEEQMMADAPLLTTAIGLALRGIEG